MKKMLAIIATLGLVSSASSSIVSFVKTPDSITTKTDASEVTTTNSISNKNIEHKTVREALTALGVKAQANVPQPPNPFVQKFTQDAFDDFFGEIMDALRAGLFGEEPVEDVNYYLSLSEDHNTIGFWISDDLQWAIPYEDTNWQFFIVDDLSQLELTIDIDTPAAGIAAINSKIRELISSIRLDARRTTDYIIPDIPTINGKPSTVGDIHILANANSNKLIGDFVIHLTKSLDWVIDYPNTGSKTEGDNTRQDIIDDIDNWYGGPGMGDGHYELIGPDEDGNWTIKADPDSPLQFPDFGFKVRDKISLSQLGMELDVDANNAGIAQIRAEAIRRINSISIGAREGRDYVLPTIPSENGDGHPSKVGNFTVSAVPTSDILTDSFNIHLFKNLKFDYPTFGPNEDWTQYQSEIEAEVRRWAPDAVLGVDYTIDTSVPGSTTIKGNPDFDVKFSFTYAAKISISDISGPTFIANNTGGSRESIEAAILGLISAKAATVSSEITPVLGVDYTIDNIVWDDQVQQSPARAGVYTVNATGTSEFFTGQFTGRIEADINAFINTLPKTGVSSVSTDTRNQILAEINKWYPRSIEENRITVTNNIDALGSWRIVANPNSFVRFNEFNFTVEEAPKWDLGDIDVNGLVETFYIDKVGEPQATRSYIQQKVQAAIATLAPNATLGTDYDIQAISYDAQGIPTKAGQYVVAARAGSTVLQGSFNINVVKWLDLDAIAGSVHRGTAATGQAIKDKLIAEILKWDENAWAYFTVENETVNNSWTIHLDEDVEGEENPFKYVEFDPFTFGELIGIDSLDKTIRIQIGHNGDRNVTEQDVVDQINAAIAGLFPEGTPADQLPQRGIDWDFDKQFTFNTDGFINSPGFYNVIAKDSSGKILGKFLFGLIGRLNPNGFY